MIIILNYMFRRLEEIPANFVKFQFCNRTPQVVNLTRKLKH